MALTREEGRKLWIAALRSGKYTQTHTHLHDKAGYCCLGVACEVLAEELTLDRHWTGDSEILAGERDYLPIIVKEFLGLRSQGGNSSKGSSDSLIVLNDVRNFDFNQIADALEAGHYWRD